MTDELESAFRTVREAYDGSHDEPNLTLQRALFRTRTEVRRQRLTRWVVIPIAAALFASTAWAGVTGRLTPAVRATLEALHAERPEHPVVAGRAPAAPPARSAEAAPAEAASTESASAEPGAIEPAPTEPAASATPPAASDPRAPVIDPGPPIAAPPAPIAAARPPSADVRSPTADRGSPTAGLRAPSPDVRPPTGDRGSPSADVGAPSSGSGAPSPAPSASAADPAAALFAEAHRVHFTERDYGRALAAWDRYLDAVPTGRFAPEARYNRAIALVRLGRRSEAQRELAPFANGMYGEYRRDDAKALLEALARDAAP